MLYRECAAWCALTVCAFVVLAAPATAADCPVSHDQLIQALRGSVKPAGGPANGGLENNEWGVVVDHNGVVCAVAFSGQGPQDQWAGSRGIAAEKANTVIGFSLKGFALSTANVYAGAQPAGPLFGIQESSPPDPAVLHAGDPATFGSAQDPMVGKTLGGIIVFGGGLALYNQYGLVGGLGVSGDSSCADHNVAWRVRQSLKLDKVPAGVSPNNNDAIIYDMQPNKVSASGYGHPLCAGKEATIAQQIGAGILPPWQQAMKQ